MMMSNVSQNISPLNLIENEACWQSLLQQNVVGIALVSLQGRWLKGNQKICEILGYSWAELVQINVQSLTYPQDFKVEINKLRQLKQEHLDHFCLEKRYLGKDQRIIWVKQTLSLMQNHQGKTQGYLLIIEDINDRKIIESSLQKNRQKIDQVLNSLKILADKYQQAKLALNEQTNHAKLGKDLGFALTQSQTLKELLDCCSEAIIQHLNVDSVYIWIVNYQGSKPQLQLESYSYINREIELEFQDILQYFNIEALLETCQPCLIDNLLYIPKYRNFSKKNNLLSFVGYPLKIEDRVIGIMAFFANKSFSQNALTMINSITDQIAVGIQHKQNEAILQKERQNLQQIVTYAPVAIAMFDQQMNYVAYSQQWLTDYELENQDLRGKNHYHIVKDLPEHWQEIQQEVLAGNIQSNPEDLWVRANGKKLYLRWAMHPWYNHDNTVGGIIMATQVINELVEAREKAFEAVRVKSLFFATMSHDIRTPMNGVLGMTDLLLKTCLNREQKDFVETLKTSGQNLLAIINDLLDFSKLETGEMSLNCEVFDLQNCLENVVELLANQADDKGIELLSIVANNVPPVIQGDGKKLHQILMNLASNAVKFTDEGAVIIKITLVEETKTEVKLKFEITDTGIGIAPEDQAKLFLSFSQVGEAQRGKYGGTGLGLAICKQLSDLMRGEIGVISAVNQGSTFWCILPFLKQLHPEVLSLSQVSPLESVKLLLIDHSLSYEMIYSYAENWKMEWYQAPSLATAIHSLHQEANGHHPYDIALVDLQSTKIDINQLLTLIQYDPLLQKTRWIILISSLQTQQAESLLHQGIDGYLLKPLRVSHLFDTFMNLINLDHLDPEQMILTLPKTSPNHWCILLVEDTPTNQKVITYQLKLLGYEVKCVNNGQEALNELHQKSYDLVLMDCSMPVLDGYATTQKLRQEEGQSRHTIIIAMTAHAFDQDRQKCLAVGMDDYISKPVTIETLEAVLSRWLPQKTDVTIDFQSHQPQILPKIEEDIIDFQRLDELTRGDFAFQKEVITIFLEDAFNYLQEIEELMETNQPEEVASYAHQLKGASSMTGIYHIPQMAKTLEIIAKENPENLVEYTSLIPQIKSILERLQCFLDELSKK